MSSNRLHISLPRLQSRIEAMARIGAIEGGGVCRLALTEADREARDLLVSWMRELGLTVSIDAIGNIVGLRAGSEALPPVMTGSHIDSVATGGRFDGTLGVLAGLEVIEALNESDVRTRRPIAVASFTNEEGARFAPDMMGSAVHQGSLELATALATRDIDGEAVEACLRAIGYAGDTPVPAPAPHAFVELHVEQGPVLEREGITIGAVTGVQGISWTEYTVSGVSNHAGTTPMAMRHDAGYAAAALAVRARQIASDMGGAQVATVGSLRLEPDLVNVVARRAVLTVDLRNTDEALLQQAEARMTQAVAEVGEQEGVQITSRSLARFEPVEFQDEIVARVEALATELDLSVRRMPSGAGHDAQMFAPRCPSGMIFVPSAGGISHNVREFTDAPELEAGAGVLASLLLELAEPV
jgi:N-carbamoyl-L-amino-acid hydrolase